MRPPVIVGALWILFLVVWRISAAYSKRTVQRTSRAWFLRVAIVIVAGFLLLARGSGLHVIRTRLPMTPTVEAIGILCTALGIAFAFWARFYLGTNWGMPMSVQENAELVTTGPYAYVRNPIYSGMLLAMLGSAIIVGLAWLSIFVISGIYFIYSATQEEKLLVKQFPDTFPAYKARTRMLVPFIL